MAGRRRTRKKILILGGGFGGVNTARRFRRVLRDREDLEIALVNDENYTVFQPMLAEVLSGSVGALDTVVPIRDLCPHVTLYVREIESIDLDRRVVVTRHPFRSQNDEIPYDHLVLGLGAMENFSIIRGLPEHGFHFKNLADALVLRNHLIHLLEQADVEEDDELRCAMLTFVVAGEGFSGVEAMAEINDYVRGVASRYANIDSDEVRMILLDNGKRILPELSELMSFYAQRKLQDRQVEVRLTTRLVAVTADEAILHDDIRIPTKTVVGALAAAANPILTALPCEKHAGRLVVNEFLEVPDYPGVWALGDCAHVVDFKTKRSCPSTAQYAMREAKCLADNIVATIDEKEKRAFSYRPLGMLGSLGQRSAVGEILGVKISGFPAWVAWRAVYWAKLPGFNRKFQVAVSWCLHLFLGYDIAHLNVAPSQDMTQQHFEAGEIVFRQGDPGDRVYMITDGEVEVVRQEPDGTESIIATRTKGDCFGEMALIDDMPRVATIRTVTSVNVVSLQRRAFDTLFEHMPGLRESFGRMMYERSRAE